MKQTLQPMGKLDGHINTFSGKKLNLLNPDAADITINDIARGLAFNSHFGVRRLNSSVLRSIVS